MPAFYKFFSGRVAKSIARLTHKPEVPDWSGHILSFRIPLIQEGQLSVTGDSVCTKYLLTTYEI